MSSKKARFMARMSPTTNNNTSTTCTSSQEDYSSSSMSSRDNNNKETVAVVDSTLSSSLTHKDVIMGRGAQATDHKGNKELRGLVRDRYGEYMGTSKHKEKQRTTQEIIRDFQRRGGRFLRPLLPPNAQLNSGTVVSWEVVTDEKVIIDKVKQMLRDVRPETELNRKLRKRKRPINEAITEGQKPPPMHSISSESVSKDASQRNTRLRHEPSEPSDCASNRAVSRPVAMRQVLTQELSQHKQCHTLSLQDLALIVGEEQRRHALAHQIAQAEQAARFHSMRTIFDLHHPQVPFPGMAWNHDYFLSKNTIERRHHDFSQFANRSDDSATHVTIPNTRPNPFWNEIAQRQQQPSSTTALLEKQRSANGSEKSSVQTRRSDEE